MSVVAETANGAVAEAMRQIEPHVVAAYPITPQTEVVEEFAGYVSDGRVRTRFVPVESEHSAMSICVGASAAGARVITATSSQGLAYMWEMLYIASGNRLPIVMALVNRALSAPINIHCDHSDSMGARDSGWIQIYCRDAQEVYDTFIQALPIAEHEDVRLPVMVCYDGFIVSHSLARIEMMTDERVRDFIGSYKAVYPLLDRDHPVIYGPLVLYDYYMEFKRQQAEAMNRALEVVFEIGKRFGKISGRSYGLVSSYRMEDADIALAALSSTARTAEVIADELRDQGIRAGVISPRLFRPFPAKALLQALGGIKVLGVLDRADSIGAGMAPLAADIGAALQSAGSNIRLYNRVYGLGGRDLTLSDLKSFFLSLERAGQGKEMPAHFGYLGVRED
ncbi:MAG: pyruvate ferredoxin oxidoreductase [bacterium]|nr:pyruvate ferredoxin oxidoreductase [bacterium]